MFEKIDIDIHFVRNISGFRVVSAAIKLLNNSINFLRSRKKITELKTKERKKLTKINKRYEFI